MAEYVVLYTSPGVTTNMLADGVSTLNGVDVSASNIFVQRIKWTYGVDGDANDISLATPAPVQVRMGGLTPVYGTTAATHSYPTVGLAAPITGIEVASATINSNSNSGVITSENGCSLAGTVSVTAISGTSPTLDLVLQETYDGTNYVDIWHVYQISATGNYPIPNLLVAGRRRWAWTIGGSSSPSLTFSINTTQTHTPGPHCREFYDRTVVLNTTNSTTPAFLVRGLGVVAVVSAGTVSAAAIVQLQFSPNGVNGWYAGSAATTLSASANQQTVIAATNGVAGGWVRLLVVTGGTSHVLNYVQFTAIN